MSIEFYRRLKTVEAEVVALKDRLAKLEAEKRPTLKLKDKTA